jgi:Amidohydrolase family
MTRRGALPVELSGRKVRIDLTWEQISGSTGRTLYGVLHPDDISFGNYWRMALSNLLLARTLTSLIFMYAGATYAQRAVDQGTVIENVTLISPERSTPLLHADVVIRDGRIVEIGTNLAAGPHARRIEGNGRFLIPGLIDSHVHAGHSAALNDDAMEAHPELWAAYRAQVPRAYLAFGFTSIVDLDVTHADQAWFESTPLHPHFYSCGSGLKVAGGYMAFNVPPSSSPNFPNLIYEPKEAEHWPKSLNPGDYTVEHAVSRAADTGAICVKAFVESGFGMFNWPYLQYGDASKDRDGLYASQFGAPGSCQQR